MNLLELRQRITKGEDLHTEFKRWPIHADELAVAVVAFANTDGGQLILGVDDLGLTTGVDDADAVMQKVDYIADQSCEPPLTVLQETIQDEEGRTVVVVNVPKGDQRPYRTNKGIYYIRTTSGHRRASRHELLRLFQSTESLYYDETPIYRARVADLVPEAITTLVERVGERGFDVTGLDPQRLLLNWSLLRDMPRVSR